MARAAFLFGSGISRDSGGPTVDLITQQILDEPVHQSFGCAQVFLKMVKTEIENHLREREGRPTNYEDTRMPPAYLETRWPTFPISFSGISR